MDAQQIATDFVDSYAKALLDRDAAAVARHYAVPALILFPGQSIPVSDTAQTEQFFGEAFGQYADVTSTSTDVVVAARTEHSIWADVAWHHVGAPGERLMYQLVSDGAGWRIAVLTPLS